MKNSNKFLLGLLSLILFVFSIFAFLLGRSLTTRSETEYPEPPARSQQDDITWNKAVVQDSSFTLPSFKYLVTDLELEFYLEEASSASIQSSVTNKGIDELVKFEVKNDTLFAVKNYEDSQFRFVFEGQNKKDKGKAKPFRVTISSNQLEYLGLLERSRITLENTTQQPIEELYIKKGRFAGCSINSDVKHLIYKVNGRGIDATFNGKAETVDAFFGGAYNGHFNGFNLVADRVNIEIASNRRHSVIEVNAQKHLNVQMAPSCYLDVQYKGNPTVVKKETSWGRVVNRN